MDYRMLSNAELTAKYEEAEEEFNRAQAEAGAAIRRMDEAAMKRAEINEILNKRNGIADQ